MDPNNNNPNPNLNPLPDIPLDLETNTRPRNNPNFLQLPRPQPHRALVQPAPRHGPFQLLYNAGNREQHHQQMYCQPVSNMHVGRSPLRSSGYLRANLNQEINHQHQLHQFAAAAPSNISHVSGSAGRSTSLYDHSRNVGNYNAGTGRSFFGHGTSYNPYGLGNNDCTCMLGRFCLRHPPIPLGNSSNSGVQQRSLGSCMRRPPQGIDFSGGSSTIANRGVNLPAFSVPGVNARGLLDSTVAGLALGRIEPREPCQHRLIELPPIPEDFRRPAGQAAGSPCPFDAIDRIFEEVVLTDNDDNDGENDRDMQIGNNPAILPVPPEARENERLEQVEESNDNGNGSGNEEQDNGGDDDGRGEMKKRLKVEISQKLKKGRDGTIEGQNLEISVSSIENTVARNMAQIVHNGIIQYLFMHSTYDGNQTPMAKGNATNNSSRSSGRGGASTNERNRSRAPGGVTRGEGGERRRAATSTVTSSKDERVASSEQTNRGMESPRNLPRPPGLGQNMLSSGSIVPPRPSFSSGVEEAFRRLEPSTPSLGRHSAATPASESLRHGQVRIQMKKRKLEAIRSNNASASAGIANVGGEGGNKKIMLEIKPSSGPSRSCSAAAGSKNADRDEEANRRNTSSQLSIMQAKAPLENGESTDEDMGEDNNEGRGGVKKRQDKDKNNNKK